MPASRAIVVAVASLALMRAVAGGQWQAYDRTRQSGPLPLEAASMSGMSTDLASIESDGARLEAGIEALTPETVRVRYRLHNTGGTPLAIFDRGDRHAVLGGRQAAGAIAMPGFEEGAGGAVTLRHLARPSGRGGFTGPTVPATPLALLLAPGATVDGQFVFAIPSSAPPRRVRWCLGIAPFDETAFFAPEDTAAGRLWQAGDDAVLKQRQLCTPWFDMVAQAFLADQA